MVMGVPITSMATGVYSQTLGHFGQFHAVHFVGKLGGWPLPVLTFVSTTSKSMKELD